MFKILFIYGTRPEAIKMAPLVHAFKSQKGGFEVKVCVTAQHRQMLDQVTDFFGIKPDFDLDLMRPDQSLFDLTAIGLKGLEQVLCNYVPDLVFVQGDTTTAFIGALAAYYKNIKVAHIEAGLRSGNKYLPFPEEINRVLAGRIADYHFAPTELAKHNLASEGIKDNVWVVGNTVIDALFLASTIIKKNGERRYSKDFKFIDFNKRIILVTGHRRESFGKGFEEICYALKSLAQQFDDVEIVYPVHLNPNVRTPVNRILRNCPNIHLIEPLDYPHLIWLMAKSYFVLTDSGGIQEEAPSFGKPVLVMRDVTERQEGVKAGISKLVGTDRRRIVNEASALLNSLPKYRKMVKVENPFGDGQASMRVIKIIKKISSC